LDAGEADAAIERTLYLSTESLSPTPQPSPVQPAESLSSLTLPALPPTHLMLSPVPEQG